MATQGQDAVALPRPGPIGRVVRVVLGLSALYFLAGILSGFPQLKGGVNPRDPLTWLGLGFAVYAMPEIVGMVFSRRWPAQRVRGVAGGAFVLAALIDLLVTGSPNGPAFGVAFGLTLGLVLGILGVSFLIAAAVAAPG